MGDKITQRLRRKMSVDSKSYELAEHFLADVGDATVEDKQELAEAIQSLCEDFCRDIEQLEALRACRSALDQLMGDSDVDGDDSPEMRAMQAASAAIKNAKAR